jgi:membrane-associated phospholipid phosphatase
VRYATTNPHSTLTSACFAVVAVLSLNAPANAQIALLPPHGAHEQTTRAPGGATAPAPASLVPSFSELFSGTVSDLRRLPTRENLTWLGAGAIAALAAHGQDSRATATLSTSASLEETFGSGAVLGGMPVQFGGALATYAIGRATNRPKLAAVGGDLVRAQLVAQTLSYGLKYSVKRTRPDGTSFSFPSGHTSVSFASASVLQRHFGWKAGIPAYAVAAYVAGSRVQQERHYLSDVVFGAAIGMVAGRTVTIGRGDARFALAPTVVRGGGGVGFTWVGPR